MLPAKYQPNPPNCSGEEVIRLVFSSHEPKAPVELIGWEGSVVRRPSSSSVHNFKRLL